MAPNFVTGQRTKVLIGSVDATQVLNNAEVQQSVGVAETPTFGDDDMSRVVGLRDGGLSLSGYSDNSTEATNELFEAMLGASTAPIVTVGPEGDTIGKYAYLTQAHASAYSVNAPVTDVVATQVEFGKTGVIGQGVWLKALGAVTTTGAQTGVNSGHAAGSTDGGTAHLHVTAGSTVTSFIAKVQHSSSSTAWADLITFSNSTAPAGVQRSTVSGVVKRHVRANVTTFSGGAGKTATYAMAFGRNGEIRG